MNRNALLYETRRIDARLTAQQPALARQRAALRGKMHAVHPAWWVGGGLLLGFACGRQRPTSMLKVARAGTGVMSLVRLLVGAGVGEL